MVNDVPFGLFLAVVDASLLGWLAQSYTKANPVLVAALLDVAAIVVTSGIFQINRIAYRRHRRSRGELTWNGLSLSHWLRSCSRGC